MLRHLATVRARGTSAICSSCVRAQPQVVDVFRVPSGDPVFLEQVGDGCSELARCGLDLRHIKVVCLLECRAAKYTWTIKYLFQYIAIESTMDLSLAWELSDTFNGLMVMLTAVAANGTIPQSP